MFSLIVTVISIALVAALAAATLYFGGDAMAKGDAAARAAQILIQGQQVLSAADLFKADTGRWPNSMEELVASEHLKQVPYVSKTAMLGNDGSGAVVAQAHAQAQTIAWTMPVAGNPTFLLESAASPEVCKHVNLKARGDNGIFSRASTALAAQCFGEAVSALSVVVSKEGQSLQSALPVAKVLVGALPTESSNTGWLTVPDATVGQKDPSAPVVPSGGGLTVSRYDDQAGAYVGPWFSGNKLALESNGSTYMLSGVWGYEGYDLLLISNSGTLPTTFNLTPTGRVWGMNNFEGPVEQNRITQIQEYGYQFCEETNDLAPGQACLIALFVPKNCAEAYTDQQGPLQFLAGPDDCLGTYPIATLSDLTISRYATSGSVASDNNIDFDFTQSQGVVRLKMSATNAGSTEDYLLVTNNSSKTVKFEYAPTWDHFSYTLYNDIYQQDAVDNYGYTLCVPGETLKAGQGCLIHVVVPDICDYYHSTQQGPFTLSVGPDNC